MSDNNIEPETKGFWGTTWDYTGGLVGDAFVTFGKGMEYVKDGASWGVDKAMVPVRLISYGSDYVSEKIEHGIDQMLDKDSLVNGALKAVLTSPSRSVGGLADDVADFSTKGTAAILGMTATGVKTVGNTVALKGNEAKKSGKEFLSNTADLALTTVSDLGPAVITVKTGMLLNPGVLGRNLAGQLLGEVAEKSIREYGPSVVGKSAADITSQVINSGVNLAISGRHSDKIAQVGLGTVSTVYQTLKNSSHNLEEDVSPGESLSNDEDILTKNNIVAKNEEKGDVKAILSQHSIPVQKDVHTEKNQKLSTGNNKKQNQAPNPLQQVFLRKNLEGRDS